MDINEIKHENYKEQMPRLKKALDNHFYLEAIFIEYSFMEERTEAILKYCNSLPKPDGSGTVKIQKKLNKLENLIGNKTAFINRYYTYSFIEEIIVWKDKRNILIHALIKNVNHTKELKELAEEGQVIVKKLCSKSTLYKKYLKTHNMLCE